MRALEFHCRTSIAINTKSSITIVQRTQKVLGWNAREIFRSKFEMFKSHLYNSMVGDPAVACHCNFGILEFSLLSILTVSQQLKHVFCSTIYQFDIQASKMRSTHFQIFLLISQKHSEFRKEHKFAWFTWTQEKENKTTPTDNFACSHVTQYSSCRSTVQLVMSDWRMAEPAHIVARTMAWEELAAASSSWC